MTELQITLIGNGLKASALAAGSVACRSVVPGAAWRCGARHDSYLASSDAAKASAASAIKGNISKVRNPPPLLCVSN
jgi:hypothetical protein